ncbi:hypothetical protein Nepgr_010774 [Nepenthes gracilis]|uniref:Uncharacterized protein n=1 Tax=Nepenthes gracilis TaxID=150966 RepID=A0AAD3SDK0_NEPGR|nr:hypothetical protein Nepgr_010774 [Nepenthes gracilis]
MTKGNAEDGVAPATLSLSGTFINLIVLIGKLCLSNSSTPSVERIGSTLKNCVLGKGAVGESCNAGGSETIEGNSMANAWVSEYNFRNFHSYMQHLTALRAFFHNFNLKENHHLVRDSIYKSRKFLWNSSCDARGLGPPIMMLINTDVLIHCPVTLC